MLNEASRTRHSRLAQREIAKHYTLEKKVALLDERKRDDRNARFSSTMHTYEVQRVRESVQNRQVWGRVKGEMEAVRVRVCTK